MSTKYPTINNPVLFACSFNDQSVFHLIENPDIANYDWTSQAKCLEYVQQNQDKEGFVNYWTSEKPICNKLVKEICRSCPVQAHCVVTACYYRELVGTWGSFTGSKSIGKIRILLRKFSKHKKLDTLNDYVMAFLDVVC